jgi:hypothetical protein
VKKSVGAVVAAALLLGGTSLATAKARGTAGAHANAFHHNDGKETKSRPTAANPYYRLSDFYYGYSDPYRGLLDFYAAPPLIPGYTYGHMKIPLR